MQLLEYLDVGMTLQIAIYTQLTSEIHTCNQKALIEEENKNSNGY